MKTFDRYILKNLSIAAVFVTMTLVIVVFLSQSLRFLELVIESGASGTAFWTLTFLALPRFFEIIVPLGTMAAVLFLYNRMTVDSEISALRAAGFSPFMLARPALILGGAMTIFLFVMTFWVAPKSITTMYSMQKEISSQFSALLFREGVFNQVGDGYTVYIRDRDKDGQLKGIMIYDARDNLKRPTVTMAKRGGLSAQGDGRSVVVYDGARQEYDPKTGVLRRLNFERYAINLPDSEPAEKRAREPDERTFFELLHPSPGDIENAKMARAFMVEIHRRITAPFLVLGFTFIASAGLLLGGIDRRGRTLRIALCVVLATLLQGGYMSAFSLSRNSDLGLPLMYVFALTPIFAGWMLLRGAGEKLHRYFPAIARMIS